MSVIQDLEQQKKNIEKQITEERQKEYINKLPNVFCPYCKTAKMIPNRKCLSDDDYVSFSSCPQCGSQTPHYMGSYLYNKHPTGLVERSVKEMKFFSDWDCKR